MLREAPPVGSESRNLANFTSSLILSSHTPSAHPWCPFSSLPKLLYLYLEAHLTPWVTSSAAAIHAVGHRALCERGSTIYSLDFLLPVYSRRSQAYEPLLLENEREAVADLLQYLESMFPFF